MKPVPCVIIVNDRWGYCFKPEAFPSIKQAYLYGKNFLGGFAFRIFDIDGKIIKSGYCNPD